MSNPIIEERVIAEIRKRRREGLRKYGVGLERTDLTRLEWLQHAKEEALDFALYLERLIVQETVHNTTCQQTEKQQDR